MRISDGITLDGLSYYMPGIALGGYGKSGVNKLSNELRGAAAIARQESRQESWNTFWTTSFTRVIQRGLEPIPTIAFRRHVPEVKPVSSYIPHHNTKLSSQYHSI